MKYVCIVLATATLAAAQQPKKVWTAEEMFRRNIGTPEQLNKQFPPHKIIGNIYYVGTESLASFLVVTPDGLILINSDYERNVPTIRDSVEKLGFKFNDIKILLGSHAHADHMEGDALVKELTGAKVMAMAQDLTALRRMMPGGKPHPMDHALRDGEEVTLGGSTLVAHLTPGHTRGCTTWTMKVKEGSGTYNVVIIGSLGVNPGFRLVNNKEAPQIADEYMQSYRILRGLACDVPLGSHPAMYNLAEKYPKIGKGANPFIDPDGYKQELDTQEELFQSILAQQKAEKIL